MSAIVSNSEIIHYEVLGRGRPVIFLHGWAGSWRYWVPSMQTIAYNYRAYALDLWGFGDSAKNQSFYGLEEQTDLLDDFITQLGIIGKVALIGHGLGAMVAIQYALRKAGKVARMMLINCPINGVFNNRLISETPIGLVNWLYPAEKDREAVSIEAQKTDQQAIIRPVLDFAALSLSEKLSSLEMPVLMSYALGDPLVSLPSELIPDSYPESIGAYIFEESGHFPMVDEDNAFSRLLRQFLEQPHDESPRTLQMKDQWKRRVR